MQGLPDDLVAAVGRVTIAAGDLELVLALVAAHQGQSDGNSFTIMARPGEPLRAARRSVQSFPAPYQDAMSVAIENAAALLGERHAVVHAMWINDNADINRQSWELLHFKTHIRRPADAEVFEGLAVRMMEARYQAVHILTAYINNVPIT